jgi:DNA-binding beta-propeller fold protein YncE
VPGGFDPSGGADVALGQIDFSTWASGLSDVQMNQPMDVTVCPSGKLFVADYVNNRVLRYAASSLSTMGAAAEAVLGQSLMTTGAQAAGQGGMYGPIGLACDGAGRLWVADSRNNRVLRFDDASNKVSGALAEGVLGQANFTTVGVGASQTTMDTPSALAIDGLGSLWVADRLNNRVLRFDNPQSKGFGGPADGVLGQTNFTNWSSAWTRTGMNAPTAVAVDGSGRLWVVDSANNRVLRFDAAASRPAGAPADGVLGQADYTTRQAATSALRMRAPWGAAVARDGLLFVTDAENYRLLGFRDAAFLAPGASAVHLLGQVDFASSTIGIGATGFDNSSSIFYDRNASRLWIADTLNHRVVSY